MKKIILFLFLFPLISYSQIVSPFITGGYPITASQAPYQASLQLDGSHICGCSILNNKWLITAAHCVKNMPILSLKVKTGFSNLVSPTLNSATFNLSQIVIHPNYNSPTLLNNDIALIRIDGNINFNPDTQPIQLVGATDNLTADGQSTKVSGWGWTTPNSNAVSNQLMMVNVPIISNTTASAQLDISYPNHTLVTTNMVATGSIGAIRQGACHGDSGGPLVATTSTGVLKQIGLVSWGVPDCIGYPNSPSIYTKVQNYLPWVNQYINSSFTVSGSSDICASGNYIYTLTNNTFNDPVSWSVSQNLQIMSSSNSSVTVKAISTTTKGQGTITATVNGLNFTKTIWIGAPDIRFEYGFEVPGNCDSNVHIVPFVIRTTPSVPVKFLYMFPKVKYTYSGNIYNFEFSKSYNGPFDLIIQATNSCGTSVYDTDGQFEIQSCYPSSASLRVAMTQPENFYKIYPNPSNSNVTIALFDSKRQPSSTTPIKAVLFDLNGQEKTSTTVIDNTALLDVRNFKKGIYVLKINTDGIIETHQVAVE